MRKLHNIICLGTLAISIFVTNYSIAQDLHQNYIYIQDYSNKKETVEYYDGFGRPFQKVVKGVTPDENALYYSTEYDEMGRECKVWKTVPGSKYMSVCNISEIPKMVSDFYHDNYGFSETNYDALGRLVSVSTPGQAWYNASKMVKTEYITNIPNSVKRYLPSIKSSFVQNGYYPEAALTGTKVTDEDGHTLETYKDVLGNVVLERRDGNKDTYFIYKNNRLSVVLPPGCQDPSTDANKVYKYQYDNRGNCIQKTLPSNIIVKYWYDKYNRLSFMQDGRLRDKNTFRFYLYDGLNRLSIQGTSSDTIGKSNYNYIANVTYGSGGNPIGSTGYYMSTNSTFSTFYVEIVNFYDGYNWLSTPTFSSVANKVENIPSVCTTSLLTAKIVATSNNKHIYRIYFYDNNANVTKLQEFYPDNKQISATHRYSVTNQPIVSTTVFTKDGKETVVWDSIQYGKYSNKPVAHYQKIGNAQLVKLEEYQYDDLGRTASVDFYNNHLTTKYEYDIHDWIKSINSSIVSSGKNIFAEKLYYADADSGKYYNGNISENRWILGNGSTYNGYRYRYDGMDRLLSAKSILGDWASKEPAVSSERYDLSFAYNDNSAIRSLMRKGQTYKKDVYSVVDNMSFFYDYDLGRLAAIKDYAPKVIYDGAFDFIDDTVQDGDAMEYHYDGNGALIQDDNKGLTYINYDSFGNLAKIKFHDGYRIEYVYSAEGEKLKVLYTTVVAPTPDDSPNAVLSKDSIEYLGNMMYENNSKLFYNFGNGWAFASASSPTFDYRFFHKDHLGNNCAVTSSTGHILQANHYYPDGVLQGVSTNQGYQKYKYNGKELDRMYGLNWYDYGARQYDPTLGQFTSMDPLCEKYYHISPYAYCAGNPINAVDPNGMDQYEINGLGVVVNRIIDKEKDAFYRVNKKEDGTYYRTGAKLVFPYSTVSAYANKYDADNQPYSYFILNSAAAGKKIFEFLADNTVVEWTMYSLTGNDANDISTVSSSHKSMYDASGGELQSLIFEKDYFINEHIHNHPSANPVEMPSGLLPGDKKGDIFFARNLNSMLQKLQKAIPKYKLYVNKKYINWNANSKPEDFGRAADGTWMPTLPEVICRP